MDISEISRDMGYFRPLRIIFVAALQCTYEFVHVFHLYVQCTAAAAAVCILFIWHCYDVVTDFPFIVSYCNFGPEFAGNAIPGAPICRPSSQPKTAWRSCCWWKARLNGRRFGSPCCVVLQHHSIRFVHILGTVVNSDCVVSRVWFIILQVFSCSRARLEHHRGILYAISWFFCFAVEAYDLSLSETLTLPSLSCRA